MSVQVCAYNPTWPRIFNSIKQELEQILTGIDYTSIEHVGSTSIPNMPAKPVIDIDIVIPSDSQSPILQDAIHAMTLSGEYTYHGERGIPGRYAFEYHYPDGQQPERKNNNNTTFEIEKSSNPSTSKSPLPCDKANSTHETKSFQRNIYITLSPSLALKNHLCVREICKTNPAVHEEYARVKLSLAQREWASVDEYCEAKNDVLAWLLEMAGLEEEEVRQVRDDNTLFHVTTGSGNNGGS